MRLFIQDGDPYWQIIMKSIAALSTRFRNVKKQLIVKISCFFLFFTDCPQG
jgi:hypothetical protein